MGLDSPLSGGKRHNKEEPHGHAPGKDRMAAEFKAQGKTISSMKMSSVKEPPRYLASLCPFEKIAKKSIL